MRLSQLSLLLPKRHPRKTHETTISELHRSPHPPTTMLPKTVNAKDPASATTQQTTLSVDVIKQYPGPQQVEWTVTLMVPGKHFPQLQPSEQKEFYEGTALGSRRSTFKFVRHLLT